MSNTQNQNQQNEEARKKYQINVLEPADFDPGIEEGFKTTQRIALAVNQLFRMGFADYAGCAVACPMVDGSRVVMILYPRFYVFAENQYKDDLHYAFRPNTLKNDNLASKVASITSPVPNLKAMVKMTQDGKDVMEEFLFPMQKRNNSKIKWEDQYQVSRMNGPSQNGQLIVTFGSLDPLAIIRRVYGTCDEEGYPYTYEVNPVRPINTAMNNGMQNWVVHMRRAKAGAAERAAADAGIMINLAQQVPMYPVNMTMPGMN